MREQGGEDSKTLFPSARGGTLSADGVQHLLARHVAKARKNCASLRKKRVSQRDRGAIAQAAGDRLRGLRYQREPQRAWEELKE
jgi:hypothetical protein